MVYLLYFTLRHYFVSSETSAEVQPRLLRQAPTPTGRGVARMHAEKPEMFKTRMRGNRLTLRPRGSGTSLESRTVVRHSRL